MPEISMSAREFIKLALENKLFDWCKHEKIPSRRVTEKVIQFHFISSSKVPKISASKVSKSFTEKCGCAKTSKQI